MDMPEVCENAESEKPPQVEERIRYSLESMIEKMKITDDERKYRAENFKNDEDYVNLFKCTKCGFSFKQNIHKGKDLYTHPLLSVLMCKHCCEYYGDGDFSLDSEGEDKYCRWCGEGGTIFSCSKCISAFCNKCIKKHFGELGLQKVINDDDWICYFCDPKPLWYLRSICSIAQEMLIKKKEELKNGNLNNSSSGRKGKLKKNNADDNSSASSISSEDNQGKASKPKKLRKMRKIDYTDCPWSSSDSEKHHKSKTNRRRVKDETGKSKSAVDGSGKESTEGESSNPRKRRKIASTEDMISNGDKRESESKIKKNILLVVDKLKGIWKMTEIVTEIGWNSSRERLKLLSKSDRVKSLNDLQKEYEKLKSVVGMLSSSLSKASNSVEVLKGDLTCENVKDERDVFQNGEAKLKKLAKKMQAEGNEDEKKESDVESSLDESISKSDVDSESKSRKKINKKRSEKKAASAGKSNSSSEESKKDEEVIADNEEKKKESDVESSLDESISKSDVDSESKSRKKINKERSEKKAASAGKSNSSSEESKKDEEVIAGNEEKKKDSDVESSLDELISKSDVDSESKSRKKINKERSEKKAASAGKSNSSSEDSKKDEKVIAGNEEKKKDSDVESSLDESISKSDVDSESKSRKKINKERSEKKAAGAGKSNSSSEESKRDEVEIAGNEESGGSDHSQSEIAERQNDENEKQQVSEKDKENEGTKGEDAAKPMLKVRSFARMTDDNVLDTFEPEVIVISEKESDEKDEAGEKNQIDEYNAETEGTSDDEEINIVKKRRSTRNKKSSSTSSSSLSDDPSSQRKRTSKSGRTQNDKLKKVFKEFREKRKQFIKNSKDNDEAVKKSEGAEKSKKSGEDDDDDDEVKRKSGQRGAGRRQVILSSEEGEKSSSGNEKVEKSGSENSDDFVKYSSSTSSSEKSLASKKKKKSKKAKKKRSGDSKSETETDEDETKKKKTKGRRNIQRILKKKSLKVETKEAIKNETERKKRVKERNILLQELFPEEVDEQGNLKRIVLDFDPETKKPLVWVHEKLAKKLKPHQVKGVKFMWDNCFESIKRLEEDEGSGCILAHCMGLGKTLQVVTLVHTIMKHDLGVNTILIICPLSVVSNWTKEFEKWLKNIRTEEIILYDLVKYKKKEERTWYLQEWQKEGGVMVISYDLFRVLTNVQRGKLNKAALWDPGPDLVICDEGHLLRNEDTALSKCVNQIRTSRRIVLTGTPLQNNLIEYHCMVQFVKPNILGSKKVFSNRFVNPINNGQFEDSTEYDVKLMKKRSHILHSLLSECVQRFDYSVLVPILPEKLEYAVFIALTETQSKAYRYFIANLSARALGNTKTATLFNDYHNLQRIWTHPKVMRMHKQKECSKIEEDDSEGSLKDFIVHSDEDEEENTTSSNDGSGSSVLEIPVKKRILRSNANDPESKKTEEEEEKEEEESKKEWWDDFFKESDFEDIRASNKLVILFSLLKHCKKMQEKVLVFTQSLYTLDLIEYFLAKMDEMEDDEEDEMVASFKDSWVAGVDYFRLDGSTKTEMRTIWCDSFNKESNRRARLFLISSRAGGLGINLCAANRVVVFDASWNPSYDLQSIFRVYRFGQKKTCYIYRFLAEATMEEKIYERQVSKLSLAHRVVDERQIERHYSMINLLELYKFEPKPVEGRQVPKVPKDKVLADLLMTFKEAIVGYHEHDSLLENQEEEELTEEEKKAAWQEFEEEKARNFQTDFVGSFQNKGIDFGTSSGLINPNQLFLPYPGYQIHQQQIPLELLQRGFQLGLTPLFNESVESFISRVTNRALFLSQNCVNT